MYDVAVVGAGVSGAFIARELSQYRLKVCLLEKEGDVCMETSKANSAIVHGGFDAKPGTKKALLNVKGKALMEEVCRQLDVPYRKIGSLVVCFDEKDIPRLYELKARGEQNGVEDLSVVEGTLLFDMEPHLSPKAAAALYCPSTAIVCPYELTLKAAENAVENGVELFLDCKVTAVAEEEEAFLLATTRGPIKTRYLVNAAGLYADELAALAGDKSFSISPRKGEYLLYDKKRGSLAQHILFQLPSEKGKGVLVSPTVDGNLIVGPNAVEVHSKEDVETSGEGLAYVLENARLTMPVLNESDWVTSFAGLRAAAGTGDFILEASKVNPRLIHVAGMESPGLTAAPALGAYVTELLKAQGLSLTPDPAYSPLTQSPPEMRHKTREEINSLIKENPSFGRIVCRCEQITEGEVTAHIHRTIGARTVDGVKRRTRAGMGRCQGGFCSSRIVEILSRELKQPMESITKKGCNSEILKRRIR